MQIDRWLLPQPVNAEGDRVPDALRFDCDDPGIAVERKGHRDQGFECVALRSACGTYVGLAGTDLGRVIENVLHSIGWNPGAFIGDAYLTGICRHLYVDLRRNPRFFRTVQRVVDRLLEDDERPILDGVAGLRDELALAAELGETR